MGPGVKCDLSVILDDATNKKYSMFFMEEESTPSRFQGALEVIEVWGQFSSL
jgi:hypothetical protein